MTLRIFSSFSKVKPLDPQGILTRYFTNILIWSVSGILVAGDADEVCKFNQLKVRHGSCKTWCQITFFHLPLGLWYLGGSFGNCLSVIAGTFLQQNWILSVSSYQIEEFQPCNVTYCFNSPNKPKFCCCIWKKKKDRRHYNFFIIVIISSNMG